VDLLATALSLGGLYLNGRHKMACWPVWLLSNVAWLTHFTLVALSGESIQWGQFVLNVVFVYLNIDGWRRWKRDRPAAPEAPPIL
jgi:hypothetical protein